MQLTTSIEFGIRVILFRMRIQVKVLELQCLVYNWELGSGNRITFLKNCKTSIFGIETTIKVEIYLKFQRENWSHAMTMEDGR